jgi:putative membrane protein
MKILLHWLILTLAVIASQYVVPGIKVDSFVTAIVVAAILAFINMIVKPIVSILTLPINILTLGLFSIVLNALFFWAVAAMIQGFSVADFKAALLGSLIVSVLNWIAGKVLD